jgi:hypothetical protein
MAGQSAWCQAGYRRQRRARALAEFKYLSFDVVDRLIDFERGLTGRLAGIAAEAGQGFDAEEALSPHRRYARSGGGFQGRDDRQTDADLPTILAMYHFIIVAYGTKAFSKANSTGAFVCKEFSPGVRPIGVKFKNDWKKGKPYLDSFEFIGISDDSARVNALARRAAHRLVHSGAHRHQGGHLPRRRLDWLEQNEALQKAFGGR